VQQFASKRALNNHRREKHEVVYFDGYYNYRFNGRFKCPIEDCPMKTFSKQSLFRHYDNKHCGDIFIVKPEPFTYP
jgi:hypothetical protein